MPDTPDPEEREPLSERFLDLFVFLPTGLAVTVVEELPQLVERGRAKFGVRVNSARAVGQLAVRAGGRELKRRSEGLTRSPGAPDASDASGTSTPSTAATPRSRPATSVPPRLRSIPRPPVAEPAVPDAGPTPPVVPTASPAPAPPTPAPSTSSAPTAPAPSTSPTPSAPVRAANGHVPEVASLAIPGFDTLSASQVVQRLAGLTRAELVAVRAYETSGRGRRTILSRVDQLLDERS